MATKKNIYTLNRVTLKDVALKTGFTVNTVSRALKSKDDISEATRELICKTAKEMGYIGDSIAGSLRSGVTRTIAVIVGDISNPLFAIMVKEIEIALRKKNYNTFIMNTEEKYDIEEKAIYSALSKKVDGIILCPTQKSDEDIKFLQNSGIPFVLMGRRFKESNSDYVVWNDVYGGYLATKHLIDLGHKRILLLNGPTYMSSASERFEGYKKALLENNIEPSDELVMEISTTSKESYKTVKKLIEADIKFTAIFAFSDFIAWEAIYTLNSLGYNVPKDIAVVGFDNIQSKLFFPVPLTTIDTQKTKTAQKVVDILLKKINSDSNKQFKEIISTRLVIRESTSSILA
jgi:Transcriptional regulators